MAIPARVPPRNSGASAYRNSTTGRMLGGLADANPVFDKLFTPVINRVGSVMTKLHNNPFMKKVGLSGAFKY